MNIGVMCSMKNILLAFFLIVSLGGYNPAFAQEQVPVDTEASEDAASVSEDENQGEYFEISLQNVIDAMFKFNALDVEDRDIIQDYAFITECDLVRAFLPDDFKWEQVLDAVKVHIKANRENYPSRFKYHGTIKLGRYDVRSGIFYFSEDTTIDGINSIRLVTVNNDLICEKEKLRVFPKIFRAVFPAYIHLEGLPMTDKEAKILVNRMDRVDNKKRVLFVTYNMSISYVVPFVKETDFFGSIKPRYIQGKNNSAKDVRLNAKLDSIQFFEDPDRTRLLYTYNP
ncbi:MAG: DUF4852 domain-containing protein [Alphaproteobacteria bacterium]|nr:DUF4852 domain-containing protein [Alphaproteobacteria bacterium]MCL2505200.1 DUF4852 domain-containing protein [Alphaproteobacteria bacterium]